ncbi:hypothetical protein CYMTET_24461 [Cymbomonas tetramitiformis]|uniref:Uncharacterized protein n=1 Tax=Cymbomonas tetramitiformis TaxID=36881 RepID=A0AAE0FWB6_9CHLO|nr:hypothetical protein CYMTET_24461 [Cymbomonas tetramitiformis]
MQGDTLETATQTAKDLKVALGDTYFPGKTSIVPVSHPPTLAIEKQVYNDLFKGNMFWPTLALYHAKAHRDELILNVDADELLMLKNNVNASVRGPVYETLLQEIQSYGFENFSSLCFVYMCPIITVSDFPSHLPRKHVHLWERFPLEETGRMLPEDKKDRRFTMTHHRPSMGDRVCNELNPMLNFSGFYKKSVSVVQNVWSLDIHEPGSCNVRMANPGKEPQHGRDGKFYAATSYLATNLEELHGGKKESEKYTSLWLPRQSGAFIAHYAWLWDYHNGARYVYGDMEYKLATLNEVWLPRTRRWLRQANSTKPDPEWKF